MEQPAAATCWTNLLETTFNKVNDILGDVCVVEEMMSTEEENQTEGDYEQIVETTEPPEAESRVVEMDFLKKMAKQALQRKYKKVKKPKQLIEEK